MRQILPPPASMANGRPREFWTASLGSPSPAMTGVHHQPQAKGWWSPPPASSLVRMPARMTPAGVPGQGFPP
jgi:hypothetical protein